MKPRNKKKNKEVCYGNLNEIKEIDIKDIERKTNKRFKIKLRWVPVFQESDLPKNYTYYFVTTEDKQGRLKTEIARFCWYKYNGELSYNWEMKECTVSWHNNSNNMVEVVAWADWDFPRPYGSRRL